MMPRRLVLLLATVACAKSGTPPQEQHVSLAPADAGEAFPAIDDACNSDEDCTTTGLFGTCCGNCEERYASKGYVARATAYCARNPAPSCPPMACSWAMSAPKCVDKKCQAAPAHGRAAIIPKSTTCTEGELTYLGFRGSGPPPRALYDAIKARFPDVMVYEVKDGTLGVFTSERHSMDVRARHEAAAATVGWKGDVVDFAHVSKDCTATFHTPMPPP